MVRRIALALLLAAYAVPAAAQQAGGPWDGYIAEAARRFDVPEAWIREVMRAESGGQAWAAPGVPLTSPAGAIGLMQIMPATYAALAAHYGLGRDPGDPHDNILAGAAYIALMRDRFGSRGFLAAYNAGPGRYVDHLATGRALPAETRRYLATVSARLGADAAPTAVAPAPAPRDGLFPHAPDRLFFALRTRAAPMEDAIQ